MAKQNIPQYGQPLVDATKNTNKYWYNFWGKLVQSVTGLNTDNTDPQNPVIALSVDGSSITGAGTPANPLVAHAGSAGGVTAVNTVTGGVTLTVANVGSVLRWDLVTPTQLDIPTATTSVTGLLSSIDWNTFNNKLSSAVTSLNSEVGAVTLTSVGGTIGITTSGSTINLETTALDAYYTFQEIATSQSAIVNFWYSCNNASLITLTLPGTANLGDKVKITGKGVGGWKVGQNVGQQIHYGNLNTTSGTGGSIASINTFDCIELVCISVNTDWLVHNSQGNLTIV